MDDCQACVTDYLNSRLDVTPSSSSMAAKWVEIHANMKIDNQSGGSSADSVESTSAVGKNVKVNQVSDMHSKSYSETPGRLLPKLPTEIDSITSEMRSLSLDGRRPPSFFVSDEYVAEGSVLSGNFGNENHVFPGERLSADRLLTTDKNMLVVDNERSNVRSSEELAAVRPTVPRDHVIGNEQVPL